MRNFVLIIISICFYSYHAFSQVCTPEPRTGFPGLTPSTDSLACIERGIYYDEVIFLENFDSFFTQSFGVITVNFLRIDSFTNIPCGIQWETNKLDNTYGPGETGCISISGTSTDSVGQYRLGLYITVEVNLGVT